MTKKKFNALKIGDHFIMNDEEFQKTSELTYVSIQNSILGETYAAPGLMVSDVIYLPGRLLESEAVPVKVPKTVKTTKKRKTTTKKRK